MAAAPDRTTPTHGRPGRPTGPDTDPETLSPAERYAASREREARRRARGGTDWTQLEEFRELLGFTLDDFQVRGC